MAAASLVGNEMNPPSASSVVTPEVYNNNNRVSVPPPVPAQQQQYPYATAAGTAGPIDSPEALLMHFHRAGTGNLKEEEQHQQQQEEPQAFDGKYAEV